MKRENRSAAIIIQDLNLFPGYFTNTGSEGLADRLFDSEAPGKTGGAATTLLTLCGCEKAVIEALAVAGQAVRNAVNLDVSLPGRR